MEEARGELKVLLASLAASKAAKGRAETKVSQWETKLASLRKGADAERIRMAEANLRNAKAKVAEPGEAIEEFDRAVQRSERELAAVVARVKEEEVDEVVEFDVEAEEMEEEIVKEEEEAKVVVKTPAGGGGGQWLKGMIGLRDAGALQDLPWDSAVVACLHPPNLDTPLLVAPESPVWTLRFLLVRVHHRLLGAGRSVWVDEGGGCPPAQAPAPRGGQRVVGVATSVAGAGEAMGRGAPPSPEMGVKMFELAQTNIFTPERKRGGGAPTGDSSPTAGDWQGLGLGGNNWVGKARVWTPTWSALLDFGGFNPEAPNRGVYAGLVHGIASRPKSKPKPAATPAGGHPQPPPPNPRGAFAKAPGAISPALDRQGTVC